MVKTGRTVELEPIDRLEEKVKLLVEDDRSAEGRRRAGWPKTTRGSSRELEAAHAAISDAETASGEMLALREERDQVRARVATMLEQLEGLRSRRGGVAQLSRGLTGTERVVPVVIQGQRYPVRSTLEPSYVAELAAYVDEKMRLASDANNTTDSCGWRCWRP